MSALAVTVWGLDLMLDLQEEMGLAYLFIWHDMAVVDRMSRRAAVMRCGEIVEYGLRRQVLETPWRVRGGEKTVHGSGAQCGRGGVKSGQW